MSHHTYTSRTRAELDREHNVLAAALSVAIPGLGHIYKGRYASGLVILLFGAPMALWIGILLSLATLGAGLIVPVFYWAMVGVCAYYAEDRRAHYPLNVL